MLIIRLQGGLGNQMFQYAFGQYLTKNTAHDVRYDISSFAKDQLRSYALEAWQIELTTIDIETLPLLPMRYGGKGVKNLWSAKFPLRRVKEKQPYSFQSRYFHTRDHSYLDGYWQNERYFEGMRDELVRKFRPAKPLSRKSTGIIEQVESSNSVALHVRRTDYLNLPEMQVCDLSYYKQAVEKLLASQSGIELFVFTDDPSWCVENINFPYPTHLVLHNTEATAHEDLWLMSRCRHHIIPNSSFSWWAAWLKKDSDGEVFVPDRWFADPNFGGSETALQSWNRILTSNLQTAV